MSIKLHEFEGVVLCLKSIIWFEKLITPTSDFHLPTSSFKLPTKFVSLTL
jgi:hypothetical protein